MTSTNATKSLDAVHTLNAHDAERAVVRLRGPFHRIEKTMTVHGPGWRIHYRHPQVGMTHADFTDGYLARVLAKGPDVTR